MAYVESFKNVFGNMTVFAIRTCNLQGDEALKRCIRRLQQFKEKITFKI